MIFVKKKIFAPYEIIVMIFVIISVYKKEILQALTFFSRDVHFHEKEKNGEHMDYFKSGFPVRGFTCLP
jgi:hypothetical protein